MFKRYEAFTWDPVRYPQAEMAAFVKELHDNHVIV